MNHNSQNDHIFLKRLTAILESHLDDEHFGVNELVEKSGLSRSQLHRRLKKAKDKSISQFIREIRLEKAKELLEAGELTVSEIAYKVGFGSPSYFVKSFHDFFGYPPGEYLKHVSEETTKIEKDHIQENEIKPFFKTINKTKKVLLKFLGIVIVISGILLVFNKFFNQEIALAVMPVNNLSQKVGSEYLAYGVQADLIGKLSELKKLRVISQRSTLAYKDSMLSLTDIAHKLNVNMLIVPGFIQSGDSLEIVLNLVDVFPDERNIYTKKYETSLQNILQFYSLAVKDIAQKLRINIAKEVDKRLSQTRTVNPESLAAYYRGMYYLGKDNPESFDTAIKYLLEAIDKDPGDPFAYAEVALGYAIKGHHSNTAEEDFNKAKYYSDIAIKLDPFIEEAYTARAMLLLYHGWEWEKAKEAFTTALRINPNNDIACAHFAWYFQVHGDYDNAIYYAKKAVTLNPLYIAYNAWLSTLYFCDGKYDEAENCAFEVLALRDSSVYANIILGWINLQRENYQAAISYTEKLPRWDYWNIYRAFVYNKSGDIEKALSFRNAMEEKAKTKHVSEWHRGLMAAVFGDKENAFKYFNIAIDKKQYQMMYLNWYPFTESIRNDSRYNDLLKRMNLPPYAEN